MTWHFDQFSGQTTAGFSYFLTALQNNATFFDQQRPLWLARAPGRLDLMGGIADYSGSLVLELPLAVATFVAAQETGGEEVVIESDPNDDPDAVAPATFALAELVSGEAPLDTGAARVMFARDPSRAWSAYALGA